VSTSQSTFTVNSVLAPATSPTSVLWTT